MRKKTFAIAVVAGLSIILFVAMRSENRADAAAGNCYASAQGPSAPNQPLNISRCQCCGLMLRHMDSFWTGVRIWRKGCGRLMGCTQPLSLTSLSIGSSFQR